METTTVIKIFTFQNGDLIRANCYVGKQLHGAQASISSAVRDLEDGRIALPVDIVDENTAPAGEDEVGRFGRLRRRFKKIKRFAKKVARSRAIRGLKKLVKGPLGQMALSVIPGGAAAQRGLRMARRGVRAVRRVRRGVRTARRMTRGRRSQVINNTVDLLARRDPRAHAAVRRLRAASVSGDVDARGDVELLRSAFTRRYGYGPGGHVIVGDDHPCRGYQRTMVGYDPPEESGMREAITSLWERWKPQVGLPAASRGREAYKEGATFLVDMADRRAELAAD